jgi:recombination DNA repair RAD52 pathway protein
VSSRTARATQRNPVLKTQNKQKQNKTKTKTKSTKNPRDTEKLIEYKVGESLENMGIGGKFLNRTPMACAVRSRIYKSDLIKLQSFCKAKDNFNSMKMQPTDWENIFTNPKSDRGLIFNIYKEVKQLDSRKPNNPIKNGFRAKQIILN